ncbi:MAG: CDP-alcohol phosphatidyltransferase family protein [Thermodesulfovibrio sp.]|nr:CDP-alcohol phosphatidyltransferase family protein [Thermodesulfovibrio sp.]
MIGEKLGHVFDKPLGGVAAGITLNPNVLTIAGFFVTFAASVVLVFDMRWGGMLVLLGAFFDILDGVVARVNNKATLYGAFLDSVLDRYSDAFIFLSVSLNLYLDNNLPGAALALSILVGALLVSYVRARAEGLGVDCKVGLMERPERILLIVFGALSGLVMPVLWILAVLTHVTVMQRILHVRKASGIKRSSF